MNDYSFTSEEDHRTYMVEFVSSKIGLMRIRIHCSVNWVERVFNFEDEKVFWNSGDAWFSKLGYITFPKDFRSFADDLVKRWLKIRSFE